MNKSFSFDVVGLGACNIDFIKKVNRFARSDDEVDIEELVLSVGGSASNFTVGLSRLSIKTGIIARIGKDYFGKLAKNEFKNEGVDTKRLLMLNEHTGNVFIAVDPDGERSMYTFMGANAKFQLQKKDIEYIKSSKMLHITGMYIEVIEEASKHANLLSFNPGTILSSYGTDYSRKIIKKADILFLNKKEMNLLTGMDANKGADILLDMGVPIVIVTLGEEGANLYTEYGVIHSPARKVKAVDTTGAGDTFAAGFIAAYVKEKKLKECLDFANLVASHCVEKLGAMNTPKISELTFNF